MTGPRWVPPWRCACFRVSWGWTEMRGLAPFHFSPVELCWLRRGHKGEHVARVWGLPGEEGHAD